MELQLEKNKWHFLSGQYPDTWATIPNFMELQLEKKNTSNSARRFADRIPIDEFRATTRRPLGLRQDPVRIPTDEFRATTTRSLSLRQDLHMTRRLSRAASPDETLHDQFASPKVQIQWISKRPMHELASKYIEVCNSCWYIRSPNPYTKMSWWFRSISGKDTAELVN
jgi:hypothetical protein